MKDAYPIHMPDNLASDKNTPVLEGDKVIFACILGFELKNPNYAVTKFERGPVDNKSGRDTAEWKGHEEIRCEAG